MKAKKKNVSPEHTGSTFDSFLEEEGIREEVEAVAVKRVIGLATRDTAEAQSKSEGARLQACRKRHVRTRL
jgi:hypothetical protein